MKVLMFGWEFPPKIYGGAVPAALAAIVKGAFGLRAAGVLQTQIMKRNTRTN